MGSSTIWPNKSINKEKAILDLLGQHDVKTTMIYTHVANLGQRVSAGRDVKFFNEEMLCESA